MTTQHSKISPSASDRWIYCPGSIQLADQLPMLEPRSSVYAADGTLMHKVAEMCITAVKEEDQDPGTYVGRHIDISWDPKNPLIVEFTKEHAEVVNYYMTVVQQLEDSFGNEPGNMPMIMTEEYVSLKDWGFPDIKGTIDLSFESYMDRLIICDLKTGQGVSVAADSNQLKIYALMKAGRDIVMYKTIQLVIVQPRDRSGEKFKSVEISPEELITWADTVLVPAINECRSESPSFHPGEKQCRWCPCNSRCPHLAKQALSVASYEFDLPVDDMQVSAYTPPEITTLTNEDISKILKLFPLIDVFMSAVTDAGMQELKAGRVIPGYKLVEGKSNRAWDSTIDEDTLVETLKKQFKLKVDQIYKKTVNSPSVIEKLFKTQKTKLADLKKYIVKPAGKPTLAEESDKRPAIGSAGKSAAVEFDDQDQDQDQDFLG